MICIDAFVSENTMLEYTYCDIKRYTKYLFNKLSKSSCNFYKKYEFSYVFNLEKIYSFLLLLVLFEEYPYLYQYYRISVHS